MREKRVLVIDDSRSARQYVCTALEQEGHKVFSAESGPDALALAQTTHFDVVICDRIMAGMDGLETIRRLKGVYPEIYTILYTAYADLDSAIQAIRADIDDYVLKSAPMSEIIFRVEKGLERADLRHRIELYENILPVCSYCRDIRDDRGRSPGSGAWVSLEAYLHQRSEVRVSHGCCPSCSTKMLESLPGAS